MLDCSLDEAADLEHAEEMAYLRLGEFPVDDPRYDVKVTEMLALPYYEGIDMPTSGLYDYTQGVQVSYDRVPKGEVEVKRSSPVRSSDDHHVGHVEGLVTDGEQHVTHVVLEHGHLWGKRDVTIPIGAVDRVEDGAVLPLAHQGRGGRARAGPRQPLATRTPADRGPWARRPPRRMGRRRRGRSSSCSRSRRWWASSSRSRRGASSSCSTRSRPGSSTTSRASSATTTAPVWWPLPVLAFAGVVTAFAIVRLPGRRRAQPRERA